MREINASEQENGDEEGCPSWLNRHDHANQWVASVRANQSHLYDEVEFLRRRCKDAGWNLQNSSGSHTVLVLTRSSSKTSQGKPEVLFNRYGTTDYLEGVETSTGNSVDIMPGIAEKIAAKKATPQPHTVPSD